MFLLLSLQVLWLAMTIHRLKENRLLTQFRCHRVVYSYPCHKDLYDICFDLHLKHPRLRHCFPQCFARPQLKHNFFSWKNCLLVFSPQCFPPQKIQTGSPFSLLYQCFSLFGLTPPLSPGALSTLSLFNHCRRLFIKASISQFSQFSSGLTCGILLIVDITNPVSMSTSPIVSNAS